MPMPRKADPEKQCGHCQAALTRKSFNGRLEDRATFMRRRFCDVTCSGLAQRKEVPTLAALRKRAERFRKAKCERCPATKELQVHHVDSNPANNDPANLMTLCGPCHTRWHWEHGKKAPAKKRDGCSVCGAVPTGWEHLKRGMCSLHYQRWKKHGDAMSDRPPLR